ncbi:MAG: hypothetical protein ACYS8L_08860 [Planctomycetota bacterium]|jgi:hypothetical protein
MLATISFFTESGIACYKEDPNWRLALRRHSPRKELIDAVNMLIENGNGFAVRRRPEVHHVVAGGNH